MILSPIYKQTQCTDIPTPVLKGNMTTFDSLDLIKSVKIAVAKKGYKTPSPIQEKAIPHLIEGRDLLGIAQTGTGKTAAFSLPVISYLERSRKRVGRKRTRVLILTPTRELASQIEANIKTYSAGLNIKSRVVFGGVGPTPQIKAILGGLDFVIATPGRLLDLMNDGHILLDELEVFILDEADRMLDMGFIHDIKKIIAKLPAKRQTLLFSATMPKDIEKLARTLLSNPVKVEVTPESTTVDKIEQSVNFLTKDDKLLFLADIVKEKAFNSGLVFTRTKHGADKVVRKLVQLGIKAAAIHGNKSQNNREMALKKFKDGSIQILVATDIAARGIDIDHISHVVNFNLPEDPKSYVHRIGRTARAGRGGIAVSLCDQQELPLLRNIEKNIKHKISMNSKNPYHIELDEDYVAPPKPKNNRRRRPKNSRK